MNPRCPLCHSNSLRTLERVAVADLIALYQKKLRVDVTAEFSGHKELSLNECAGCELKFFLPFIEGSAEFYDSLQQHDWYYLHEKSEYRFASQQISERASVLDVGCGAGRFADHLPGRHFTGLELSHAAREKATARGLNVRSESVQAHARQQAGRYDVVSAFQVIEHVADIHSFIRAGLECLRPGGLLIYSVPSADSFVAETRNGILNLPPHHLSWWSDLCLRRVAEIFGLQLVALEHESLDPVHFRWYGFNQALRMMTRLTGCQGKLIDRSMKYKITVALAAPVAAMYWLRLRRADALPRGHSVTAVYRRAADAD
ncbi:MAG: class I SAM-dependent methyltransferase [Blastocatellia bacterium]